MAQPAATPTPPPIQAEHESTPPAPVPPPQQQTTNQETEYLRTTTTTTNSLPSQQLQSQPPQTPPSPPPVPLFINSINELRNLSAALAAFNRCYDDLQDHLNSIKSAIDSKLPPETPPNLIPPPHENLPIVALPPPTSIPSSNPFEEKQIEKETKKEKPIQSELESLCVLMSGRGLRKYMVTNIGEPDKLREEVPAALKLSPNPAKLVLECSGRFFLQGIRAYTKGSPMIPAREASVLVLECFLLMGEDGGNAGGVNIDKALKEEAAQAAMAWRKRLISEGGLAKASEIDARGLLFFIVGFGVTGVFRIEDFGDLIRAGNVKDIAGVLKRSSVLMTKISDIIGVMAKNKMAVDAVDIAYTIGLEDKFSPQNILTSFLRESKESWKRTKRSSLGAVALNEANKKQLAALRSVVKCLESHEIDPSKLLSGWQIKEKILRLEKNIADSDKFIRDKIVQKRKADETESSELKAQEVKRSRYNGEGSQEQKAAIHIDRQRNLLDGGYGWLNRTFASPSVLHGAGAGLLPENIAGSVSGTGSGVLGTGGSGGISASATGVQRTGSYAGVHAGSLVDTAGRLVNYDGLPYGLRGDAALNERLAARTYAGQSPSYGLSSLYRQSASLEGFPGLPSSSTVGVANRSSAADLYQFADAVAESESYRSSGFRTVGDIPAHHSSYLY